MPPTVILSRELGVGTEYASNKGLENATAVAWELSPARVTLKGGATWSNHLDQSIPGHYTSKFGPMVRAVAWDPA